MKYTIQLEGACQKIRQALSAVILKMQFTHDRNNSFSIQKQAFPLDILPFFT